MERYKMPLNEWVEDKGLTLKLDISFIKTNDGKMELLGFAVSDGCNCVDYSSVVEHTTLVDLLEEFIR